MKPSEKEQYPEEMGLFTFYREQAEYQDKIALHRKLKKINKKKETQFQKERSQTVIQEVQATKSIANSQMENTKSLKQIINKQKHRKKSPITCFDSPQEDQRVRQKFGESVIIIKKKQKPDQKLCKNYSYKNSRYGSEKGHYIKKKQVNLFGNQKVSQNQQESQMANSGQMNQKNINAIGIANSSQKNYLRLKMNKDKEKGLKHQLNYLIPMKINPPYIKHELQEFSNSESEQISNINLNLKRSLKLSQSKKVQIFPQLKLPPMPSSQQIFKGTKHKVLSSMLKSSDTEMMKHIRRALQFQRLDNSQNENQQSTYIQYNKYTANDSPFQFKSANLNEKQKRLLNVLHQFKKVHGYG